VYQLSFHLSLMPFNDRASLKSFEDPFKILVDGITQLPPAIQVHSSQQHKLLLLLLLSEAD